MFESIDSESVNGISRVQFLLEHTDAFTMMDSESCTTSAAHIHFQVAALVAVCVCVWRECLRLLKWQLLPRRQFDWWRDHCRCPQFAVLVLAC